MSSRTVPHCVAALPAKGDLSCSFSSHSLTRPSGQNLHHPIIKGLRRGHQMRTVSPLSRPRHLRTQMQSADRPLLHGCSCEGEGQGVDVGLKLLHSWFISLLLWPCRGDQSCNSLWVDLATPSGNTSICHNRHHQLGMGVSGRWRLRRAAHPKALPKADAVRRCSLSACHAAVRCSPSPRAPLLLACRACRCRRSLLGEHILGEGHMSQVGRAGTRCHA